jgi:hypothetical protein
VPLERGQQHASMNDPPQMTGLIEILQHRSGERPRPLSP